MDTNDLIKTVLHDRHIALGAKMAPFGGWSMPLDYGSTVAEHDAVREGVGVFDVGHLGTVFMQGARALDVILQAFSNDARTLEDGQSQYTLCVDDGGGIIDDLIVYRFAADRWMVVPNAGNRLEVVARLHQLAGDEVDVDDVSEAYAIIAVQGATSLTNVSDVLGIDAGAVPYLNIEPFTYLGETGYLCRTGYTGEVGCELVIANAAAGPLFDALLESGATPAGLGARDTLRMEMGYPLHGNDIGPDTKPVEARLSWAVKLDRDDFIGRDALMAAKAQGPARRLLGIKAQSRGIPRAGMTVQRDGVDVGDVRSGTFSPTLKTGIGLAYLADPIAPGDTVEVDVRGKSITFDVVRPPFVERDPKG